MPRKPLEGPVRFCAFRCLAGPIGEKSAAIEGATDIISASCKYSTLNHIRCHFLRLFAYLEAEGVGRIGIKVGELKGKRAAAVAGDSA